jgi:gliding motility-associated-like protein
LPRVSIFVTCLVLSVLQLSAQSGSGYLEFVENKGQWDTAVHFRSKIPDGKVYMHRKGFTILMEDTADLKRIGELLHGDFAMAGVAAPKGDPAGGVATNAVSAAGSATMVQTKTGAVAGSPEAGLLPGSGGGGRKAEMLPPGWGTGSAKDPMLLHSHSYRVSFLNASDNVSILPDKAVASYENYMVGDKKNWTSQCKIYHSLLYKDLYKGIDVHYYTDLGTLKYDIVVHPGGDLRQVILQYDGQTSLSIHKNRLYIQTSVGTVQELEPNAYEVTAAGRTEVACKYTLLSGNKIGFKVDDYSPDATLVIDPTLFFCSFTGSTSDNWGYSATYDNNGCLYMGGIVLDETNFQGGTGGGGYPASPGAFQTTFQGGEQNTDGYYQYDVGIMKLSTNGADRVYATYLGGSGNEQPHSMIVDNSGDLIVMGRTSSTNFPVTTKPVGNGGGYDLFVTKFNPQGTGLIGSIRIGGSADDGVNYRPKYADTGVNFLRLNYGDDGRGEIIQDAGGNLYVAACTQSIDFPVTAGVFQPSPGSTTVNSTAPWLTQDGVLIKLTPNLNSVTFASYLGGSGIDAATVLALSPLDNSIWVAGGTLSTNFPGTSSGTVYNAVNNGGIDGFISIVSNDGKTLEKSSYFGTKSTDMIYGIDFDKYGYAYITGTTSGVVPIFNSPFNANGNQVNGNQFITKLKTDLSGLIYSSNFGPGGIPYPNISPTAFLVDRCENVYVSGWGGGPNNYEDYTTTGTFGLTTTSNALRATTDGSDFYFFVLQRNAASQLYGSFFGQVNGKYGDHVDGGTSRFDAQGVIYEAICANCYGGAVFPTTAGAYATKNGTGTYGCNEAGVKIAFNFAGVSAGLKVVTHGRGDSVGCVPLTAVFSDTIRNAKSYIWNFGDGTVLATTSYTEEHTYTSVGSYLVTLIAIDSNTCNIADTVMHTVIVGNNPASVNFDYAKVGVCTSMSYILTNLSGAPPGYPFSDTAFTWSFGDGTVLSEVGPGYQPTHSYAAPGPYNVTLTLLDTEYCNYPLDTTRILYVAQNVKASFTTPALGCVPYTAQFNNTSIAGQQFYWNFGDPASGANDSSNLSSPTHLYSSIGTYTVTLKVVDSTTCNIKDSLSFTLTVQNKPTAAFTYSPLPPQPPNTPTVFTDASSPGVKYQWFFGDGTSETKTVPDTVVHLYNQTDTFQVCEIVTNASGCMDTACQAVSAVINPLLDVPNAFTPGRFGVNAVVKVVGFGITHMDWRIYNRWGQVVFESNDPYIGWDGTYHGTVQPMDVYAYTLQAEFSDGSHTSKKGDITLIR